MPKLGKFFNIQLVFSARDELKQKLIALAYLRGDEGQYAPIARDIMTEAVERFIQELDPQEQKEFREILETVKTAGVIEKMEREEKRKERLKVKEPSLDLKAGDGG